MYIHPRILTPISQRQVTYREAFVVGVDDLNFRLLSIWKQRILAQPFALSLLPPDSSCFELHAPPPPGSISSEEKPSCELKHGHVRHEREQLAFHGELHPSGVDAGWEIRLVDRPAEKRKTRSSQDTKEHL